MIDAVVKVGGSLGRGACVPALGARLADLGRRYGLLVVPGGGAFADVVRDYDARFALHPSTAHWMAVLAMEQFGHLLADQTPGALVVRDLEEARKRLAGGGVAVALPSEALRRSDSLPHSWAVTSDSIAAWVAGEVGAGLLVLLKDRHGMENLSLEGSGRSPRVVGARDLAAAPGVDDHLATLLGEAAFDLWVLDGEHPERLAELLETGSTEGVRLARPDL